MEDFEKLGVFYLGKVVDPKEGKLTDELLLYDSKDLTTHAVCVGMTGSGKTGLGIAILEEAAIDKIPSIIIDPKGDLGNLLLAFPSLNVSEFKPWVDIAEAERKGMDIDAYAENVAKTWKEGLSKWGEGAQRIENFKNAADVVIYTPASKAGVPLSILSSFAAPSKEMMLDTNAVRDRILSVTSSLLGLLGINADPIKSREHILISTILSQSWEKGVDLDIPTLIQEVQKPSFTKIGVLDVDTFFPIKERLALSISLNNLLASPGFQAWMQGEPLDIDALFHTAAGKPKLSVISIAHLSDPERMFFVTLLLNELLSWMRRQSGTSSLRAILYMDEIFGYFPPTSVPPSKIPMLTLLKQARAFGLGIVLSTQNPVDLDYKGLSNCGTWFIGKLQTERDKARILEGLAVASNGEMTFGSLDKMLAFTGNRTFIMRSIHVKDPVLFQTRWTLSYLRGPLTLSQIDKLTNKAITDTLKDVSVNKVASIIETKPLLPPGITEYFFKTINAKNPIKYTPQVMGIAKLHFVDSKNKIDVWQEICMIAPTGDNGQIALWEEGKNYLESKKILATCPVADCTYEELPGGLMQKKNYEVFEKTYATSLYQTQTLMIYKSSDLNLVSKDGETEGEFRARATLAIREKRDDLIAKLRLKYADKIAGLTERVRRADEKANLQKKQAGIQIAETVISFGATILGAVLGKQVTKGTISQTGTSLRKAGKITKETQEASQAQDNLNAVKQQLEDLKEQMQREVDKISQEATELLKIDSIEIHPRKSDISIETVALIWCPEDFQS